MKFALIFAAVLAVSSAQFDQFGQSRYSTPRPVVNRVASSDQAANIISYENDIYPDGSFKYSFYADNGISAQAQGTPKVFNGNPPVAPVVIQGSFGYTSPEGVPVGISYTADENGYQATGDSIPTPPPIPEAILKALAYIASKPPAPQKK